MSRTTFIKVVLAASAGLIGPATSTRASDSDAWTEFRTKVETACRAAASSELQDANIVVDPFGSASYGLAILSGSVTKICVFDKRTEVVEIGSELGSGTENSTPTMTVAQRSLEKSAQPGGGLGISFDGAIPYITGACMAGEREVLSGIDNVDGELQITSPSADSTFGHSCINVRIEEAADDVSLKASCLDASGIMQEAELSLAEHGILDEIASYPDC